MSNFSKIIQLLYLSGMGMTKKSVLWKRFSRHKFVMFYQLGKLLPYGFAEYKLEAIL